MDMPLANEAAWLSGKGANFSVGPAEVVNPGPGEVLIRNQAWAINPIDWKMQAYGIMIESYPAILGCDVAGEVAVVGENVTSLKVGDRVAACSWGVIGKKTMYQAFQLYTLLPAQCAMSLPSGTSFEDAVKLPLGVLTASAGLYEQKHLELPLPTANNKTSGRTLLIWGGSSNVGSAAIQLAVASGIEVITTASVQNFDAVRKAGAAEVFNHNDPRIVEDLIGQLRNKTLVGAFDAISSVQTTSAVAEVLSNLGGGKVATTTPSMPSTLPANVEVKLGNDPTEPEVGKAVWQEFMPVALKTGQMRSHLNTMVIGRGLQHIQAGVNEVKRGVSSTKVVILA
ncbi:hypothetical protein AMS68_002203 [Peltaster fructicola]|uniref:Enoyl reductase (ER) domain-containing protein n=1 Tax=Peltaster fructicola TaxID=286661 RepID=A0A6H0XPS2_9PEZI|nr:hypothetical protein AMS68_002203 [Peltaster fructicola]